MGPKCNQCFYSRRGSIITYSPVYTCLHPLVRDMDPISGLPEQCAVARGKDAACGPEGALFRPAADDSADLPPLHRYRN